MDWRDVEQQIDRELKALPAPTAPVSLLPRVMAASSRLHSAPWYSRAWLTWPLAAQLASVLVLTLVGFAAWWAMPVVTEWTTLSPAGTQVSAWASGATAEVARVLALARAVWLVVFEPVLYLLIWVAVVASLVAAACWAAVNRLALGGASLS